LDIEKYEYKISFGFPWPELGRGDIRVSSSVLAAGHVRLLKKELRKNILQKPTLADVGRLRKRNIRKRKGFFPSLPSLNIINYGLRVISPQPYMALSALEAVYMHADNKNNLFFRTYLKSGEKYGTSVAPAEPRNRGIKARCFEKTGRNALADAMI